MLPAYLNYRLLFTPPWFFDPEEEVGLQNENRMEKGGTGKIRWVGQGGESEELKRNPTRVAEKRKSPDKGVKRQGDRRQEGPNENGDRDTTKWWWRHAGLRTASKTVPNCGRWRGETWEIITRWVFILGTRACQIWRADKVCSRFFFPSVLLGFNWQNVLWEVRRW